MTFALALPDGNVVTPTMVPFRDIAWRNDLATVS